MACHGIIFRGPPHVKTLFLLRHAKSSWKNSSLPDFDRPLTKRGRKAGKLLRKFLAGSDPGPALVICSGAKRTRETLDLIRPALPDPVTLAVEDGLYLAGADRLLSRIRRIDSAVTSAMVIGHNPDLEILALALAGNGDPSLLRRLEAKFPTGALAILSSEIDTWKNIGPGNTRLVGYVRPDDLDGEK